MTECLAVDYDRVSTLGQNVETQRREVLAFIEKQGWSHKQSYCDVGVSGAKATRPALDKLKKDAWKGEFDIVVCWDISRLARSTLHALDLLQEFQKMKIRIVFVKQCFDSDSALGRAFFTLGAMFAELERAILIERVRAGIARAKAEGKRLGRPCVDANPEAVRTLKEQNLPWPEIARRLRVSVSTAKRRLRELTCQVNGDA
jgi:DNA invertase Pin-like site-specific DNA recombinase